MKRTISRIIAMMVLYQYELTGDVNVEAILTMHEEPVVYDEELVNQLIEGVIANEKQINHTIGRYLENYTIDRIGLVDRNLLRVGVYELMFTNTPTSIIINEIIEISKEYSEIDQFETSKFNNALLDKIAKGLKNARE